MVTPFGTFGWPGDPVALCSLAFGLLLLATTTSKPLRRFVQSSHPRLLLWPLAVTAVGLSAGYVQYYLGGAPRVIDATSYFLEGRVFATGHWTFDAPGPLSSFNGRFLVGPEGAPTTLSPIFPPGYPALLAAGFWLGHPMWVGPLIAGSLVLLTFALGLRLFDCPRTALLAAALSVTSATLRYHTADTMSHGWAALLVTLALFCGSSPGTLGKLLAGFACGWLFATRPVSGLAVAAALFLWQLPRLSLKHLATVTLGALPGLAFFLVHQEALTGSWFESSQRRYYALTDGPPGCFAYGLSQLAGCLNEHRPFVERFMPNGHGLWEALGTTFRRLTMHLRDAANVEVLALAVPAALWFPQKRSSSVRLFLTLVLFALAYSPFYFDGNYPGGGARFFADVLPLEHLLLAHWGIRAGLGRFLPGLSVLGFACHTHFDHATLQESRGGRPMFENRVLERAGVQEGLVFVDTDHGFNLGFDPRVRDARRGVVVARDRGVVVNRALYDALGRPPTYVYNFDFASNATAPALSSMNWTHETTASLALRQLWPPLHVSGGWIERPDEQERGLILRPNPGETLQTRWALPGDTANGALEVSGTRRLETRVGINRGVPQLSLNLRGAPLEVLEVAPSRQPQD